MSTGPFDEAGFLALTRKIAEERGFGCANYKDGCLRRRIAVRMRACGVTTYADYRARLDRDPGEYDLLLDALTINVTKLYRDAGVWDAMAAQTIPELWALDQPRLTVWSAGCSSGEELYTLAALFHRHAERTGTLAKLRRLRIIGSDIDRASLEAARAGAYAAEAFQEMPDELRTRYFSREAPHRAAPELRALVEVERRDLLADAAPQQGLQLITCRNVVIYFDRPSQVPLMRKFREALAPGGVLVLGKVETLLGEARKLFDVVDARQRIFRRAAA
jgi:chemotaxis methyl-accepting protein methylase